MSGRKPRFKCKSEAQKKAIKISYAKRSKQNKNGKSKKNNDNKRKKLPTGNKSIPFGRTLSTFDQFLPFEKGIKQNKKRGVVVIDSNKQNHLAVVALSTKNGKNKTHLPNYEQGDSYFKHFVEVKDNEGQPIVIGEKFRANNTDLDVSLSDSNFIVDKVLNHVPQGPANKAKIEELHSRDNECDSSTEGNSDK